MTLRRTKTKVLRALTSQKSTWLSLAVHMAILFQDDAFVARLRRGGMTEQVAEWVVIVGLVLTGVTTALGFSPLKRPPQLPNRS